MNLSKRAQKLVSETQPLVKAHFACAADPWHPQNNPGGYVNLGTAENHLMWDVLEPKLNRVQNFTESHTHYDVLYGNERFRKLIAGFFGKTIGAEIDPEHIAIASGSSAIVDFLMHAICDPGEGVIIPAPYYAGFDHDLKSRAGVEPVPAYLSEKDDFRITPEVLQNSIMQARKREIKIRAILITSPHNPTGRVPDKKELEDVMRFAADQKLQVISDELYARSVFDEDATYVSMNSFVEKYKDVPLHIVYGFAKDFSLSGFKTGLLCTKWPGVLSAVKELCYFSPVSTATQHILSEMISDEGWMQSFHETNSKRLKEAWEVVSKEMDSAEIPHVKAEAGFFVWINLKKALAKKSFESEMELFYKLLNEGKVNIAPGQVFHSENPGWFRLCYARNPEMITEAVKRIKSVTG